MDENVLKKEFGKKDVTRLRNLMTGKHNSKNGQSVGYSKKQTFYKEGDICGAIKYNFVRWCNSGLKASLGLFTRRIEEYELFMNNT